KLDPAIRDGVYRWFADYARWMNTSKNGLDEKKSGNNHASWWTAQVAAFSALTGDREMQAMAFRWLKDELFAKQIRPDGSAPREEARTKSLGYSAFNLEAYTVTCRVAELQGTDLWHVRTKEGATIQTVVDYQLAALRDPKQWKKEQIVSFENEGMYYLAWAGTALHK